MSCKVRFRQILVQCPARPYDKPEKMEIKQILTADRGWFPAPCDGCNSMNSLMPCDECCALITRYFHENPDLVPLAPLHLHLSTGQIELAEDASRM